MQYNIILAGVGGQGILTIAQVLSTAGIRRGWTVKQAEVHGMSQRGGAVYSHVRISDGEIHSDLIPSGECDLIIAMEPLESLRYVGSLREDGQIVANTTPLVNMTHYPAVEDLLDRICACSRNVLVDADRLARTAGSVLAGNSVLLGAASTLLEFDAAELEIVLAEILGRKGDRVVETNRRAFRLGRSAASAYAECLRRGARPAAVRRWLAEVPPERLLDGDLPALLLHSNIVDRVELSETERPDLDDILRQATGEHRAWLFEHEVYAIIERVGFISPPRHRFVAPGETLPAAELELFAGDQVVLKVVSRSIVHKSDVGGVVFVPNDPILVNQRIRELIERQHHSGHLVNGVLVVEFVERSDSGFGQELFVGIRHSRAFGAVIAAGLGGVDTEYLAGNMKPGTAVARAMVADTTPERFLDLFKKTAAYDVLAGRIRGHRCVVADGELLRCFRAFMAIARALCTHRVAEPSILELEVNPFAFSHQRMVPLDGRARIGAIAAPNPPRPLKKLEFLLEPRSIVVVGVSAKRQNFGRIILANIRDCGFPVEHLYVLKQGVDRIDGVRCIDGIANLPEKVDLLVAAASKNLSELFEQAIKHKNIASIILIPGALGETQGSEMLQDHLRAQIQASRSQPEGGVVVLGGNCLGARSRPGRYDTFFVPKNKLSSRRDEPTTRTALITQSGGFALSRISNLAGINPVFAITIGNQIDLTVSDCLRAVGPRDDVDAIGVYVEGFQFLDGLAFVHAVRSAVARGKQVVFYKAGRTQAGQSATAGHTASLAGDYDVCQCAAGQAGAIVVDTFKEFEQVLDLATAFHHCEVRGRRIGVITNAGFEAVGMADAIIGARYALDIPELSENTRAGILNVLTQAKLHSLVNVRNPLDITPMAGEEVYAESARAFLEDENIDAVIVSVVPFTSELTTTAQELELASRSLADELPELLKQYNKPLIAVIDAGKMYDPLALLLRRRGIPVFPSCDQAIRSLGRYVCHRVEHPRESGMPSTEPAKILEPVA